MARILKDKLGCSGMDFCELNCSDSRGIDTIREIARSMHLAPTGGKVRIWLLDEVHQLSKDAQHGSLKIFEDTPKHVYFFLCTTDPHKLLKTIRTRCTEMPVRDLTYDELEILIKQVCKKEEEKLDEEVLEAIITNAMGSARTALVLLDKALNLDEAERLEGVQLKAMEESKSIELCRILLQQGTWKQVTKILKGLTAEPETIRYSVMLYANAVLRSKKDVQAFRIIQAFEDNFYDSKAAGVVRACYECLFID